MQIKGLLPNLDGTDLVVSPSLHQLADLARSGGASELERVQSFMVEHKTWGSVRWLEPVDVRSLVLQDLVQISRRNILVSTSRSVQAKQLDSYLDLQPVSSCTCSWHAIYVPDPACILDPCLHTCNACTGGQSHPCLHSL